MAQQSNQSVMAQLKKLEQDLATKYDNLKYTKTFLDANLRPFTEAQARRYQQILTEMQDTKARLRNTQHIIDIVS